MEAGDAGSEVITNVLMAETENLHHDKYETTEELKVCSSYTTQITICSALGRAMARQPNISTRSYNLFYTSEQCI